MSSPRLCLSVGMAMILAAAWRGPCAAQGVPLSWLLRDNVVYIATTETPAALSPYIRDWATTRTVILPISETDKYKQQPVLIFIIDRSQVKEPSALFEEMLPLKYIPADEVVFYSVRPATVEYGLHRKNRWTILISAPDQKWLHRELDRINRRAYLSQTVNPKGREHDRFSARPIRIVTTEGAQLAKDWMNLQAGETREFEFVTIPVDQWKPDPAATTPTVFMLDRQKINEKECPAVQSLPVEMQRWLAADASRSEIAAEKQITQRSNGQRVEVCAVVAPSERLLAVALLEKFTSMPDLPRDCSPLGLADLRKHGRLIVVARFGNRSDKSKKDLVNDLAGKITTALGSIGGGFECASHQDLVEAVWASEMNQKKLITNRDPLAIELEKTEGLALAVADLNVASGRTQYALKSAKCVTLALRPFEEAMRARGWQAPTEPKRPSVDDLTGGNRGAKKYPDGINDPKFRADLINWQKVLMPQYEEQVRQLAAERDVYEAQRQTRPMEWVIDVDATETAQVAGNLRILDLENYQALGACRVLYSCDITGAVARTLPFKSDRVTVTGEAARPTPDVPADKDGADPALASQAIDQGCRRAANMLRSNALLPIDRPK